jgi:DNA-directed RNA polymerase subunit K/omega
MSARSKLLFRAHGRISNPLLLCTLVSKRTRQLMMGGIGNRNTAEVIDYALGELLDGVLAFEMPGKKVRKSEPPLANSPSIVTISEALELEAI